MKDLSYLKIISLITIIIFLWSNIVIGGPVGEDTLRSPLIFGPGGEKERVERTIGFTPSRGAALGAVNRLQHEIIRDFIRRTKAYSDKYRSEKLEAKFGVKGWIRIQVVPGMFRDTGVPEHYAIRKGIVYIDEDFVDIVGPDREGHIYVRHIIFELLCIIGYGESRGWSRHELVDWLDEKGDPDEVNRVLLGIHDEAPKLPEGHLLCAQAERSLVRGELIRLLGLSGFIMSEDVVMPVADSISDSLVRDWIEIIKKLSEGPREGQGRRLSNFDEFCLKEIKKLIEDRTLLIKVIDLYLHLRRQELSRASYEDGTDIMEIIWKRLINEDLRVLNVEARSVRGAAGIDRTRLNAAKSTIKVTASSI